MMTKSLVCMACFGLLSAGGGMAQGANALRGVEGSPSEKTAVNVRPVYEHFALVNADGHLDGPRRESVGPIKKVVCCDAKGNIYFMDSNYFTAIRCARVDGMVETISGDDCWGGSLPIQEGPAAFVATFAYGGGYAGGAVACIAAQGAPLEGEDKGCLYSRSGRNGGMENCIIRIYKNKDKENRWWFKKLMGGGKTLPPETAGQSAPSPICVFTARRASSLAPTGP